MNTRMISLAFGLVVVATSICFSQVPPMKFPDVRSPNSGTGYLKALSQPRALLGNELMSLTDWPSSSVSVPEISKLPVIAAWTDNKDLKRMRSGRWVVMSVKRDGPTNGAQAGQEVGDVITIEGRDEDDGGGVIFG